MPARRYIPNYPRQSQSFDDATHDKIDALGATHGCHSCGKKPGDSGFQPAGKDHNFTPDHQPPGTLKKGGDFRLYPQCGNVQRPLRRQHRRAGQEGPDAPGLHQLKR